MTEEIKEEQKCSCGCECAKTLKEFFLRAGAVFVGTLFAILVASALLRPSAPPCKCHKGMHGMHPGIEKRIPPIMRHNKQFPQKFEGQSPDFKGKKTNYDQAQRPQIPNQK
ncbi:hypothetical protein J6G99_02295 [bacterium]|nr:hypothetical protein [bacterium]